ncbi:MAG TPA: phage/plasmid primase, P4 family [Thiobacillus sp.]|nr:phage/plasmid primase, P4 family [Thiobacillus sp.]
MVGANHYDKLPTRFVKLKPREKVPEGTHRIETADSTLAQTWQGSGYNVGIVPSDQIVIADIDPRNGGDETFKGLFRDQEKPRTVISLTGGGGLHLFFRWDSNWGKPRGTLGAGVDIKHGDNCHVVAPGSIHPNGSGYRWKPGNSPADVEIALCPSWLRGLLARSNTALPANIPVTTRTLLPETPDEIAKVQAMLGAISADCERDTWRQIVWSVLATRWACAAELVRIWSQSASVRYDEREFNRVVDSFKPEAGTSLGTLIYHAREAGWVETTPEQIDGSGADVRNGQVFAAQWRSKLLFIHETNDVLAFDKDRGWIVPPPGESDRAAKQVLDLMRSMASERYLAAPDDYKTKRLMAHVERTSRAPNLRAMVEMAKSEPGMMVSITDFDNAPMQLGLLNGILDLKQGALLPVSHDIKVSKRCNVAFDAGARCPQFHTFLVVIQPDPDMRAFLQRWAGYCLTGGVTEQKFVFLYGSGANGKSVFVELLAWLLGDYARKIATEMLMQHQRNPQGASPDIVALKGRRFVYANETEEGRRLAEARIKDMTGGDTLTGRVPYSKADITFHPTHKLAVVGNHKPEITDNSFGMWRRVCLVPFDVTVAEADRDPHLLDKLKAEGPGILNWALEGLRQWQSRGLAVPSKIEAATAAYRDEQDLVGEWITDHCTTGPGQTVAKAMAYRAYRSWALSNGHHPFAQGRLTRRLGDRGYKTLPDKRTIAGLALNSSGNFAAQGI